MLNSYVDVAVVTGGHLIQGLEATKSAH